MCEVDLACRPAPRRITNARRLALAGCVALLGCAGTGSEEPGYAVSPRTEPIVIAFTVSNQIAPPASVTIRLQGGGTTWILGNVTPGQERTFPVDLPEIAGEYQLTATSVAFTDAITSQAFSLSPDSWVRWTIADNSIEVGQRQETSP
jgi:hypothetical protein